MILSKISSKLDLSDFIVMFILSTLTTFGIMFISDILLYCLTPLFLLFAWTTIIAVDRFNAHALLSGYVAVFLGLIVGFGAFHFPLLFSFFNWIGITLILFVVLEILFWTDSAKPEAEHSKIEFTICRKLVALVDLMIIAGIVSTLYFVFSQANIIYYLLIVLKFIGIFLVWIAIGAIVLGVIAGILYLFIKANSLKYRNIKKTRRKNDQGATS